MRLSGWDVVLAGAEPDLIARERESGGRARQHADHRRHADDEAPRSPFMPPRSRPVPNYLTRASDLI